MPNENEEPPVSEDAIHLANIAPTDKPMQVPYTRSEYFHMRNEIAGLQNRMTRVENKLDEILQYFRSNQNK